MNYFYQNQQGQSIGPVTAAELVRLRELGVIQDGNFVCQEGTRKWIPYSRANVHLVFSAPSHSPVRFEPLIPQQPSGIRMDAPNAQNGGTFCPQCNQNVGIVYDLSGWAIVLFLIGLLFPLWIITLPLFWWLAYINRRGQRRCGLCRMPM